MTQPNTHLASVKKSYPAWVVDAIRGAPPLLTFEFCAEVAGVPVAAVADAAASGELIVVRFPGHARIPRLSLASWLLSLAQPQ